MKVYIRQNTSYHFIVLYVLKLIEKNANYTFRYVDSADQSDIIWDHEHPLSQIIALDFYEQLSNQHRNDFSKDWFFDEAAIKNKDHKKDVIASIFYMVNCMQEYFVNKDAVDSFGRFKYEASYQSKFKNIDQNLVQNEIDKFCLKWNILVVKEKSTFFISHDIDTIYGSFFQDGLWAAKRMKIGVLLNLIIWELSNRQHWKNIDKILKLNTEYDIRSTFFWLVNQGEGTSNIKNADYDLRKEKQLTDMVAQANFVNGLHKSCSDMTIDEELKKGELDTTFNRYHFLKFSPHTDWRKISDSQLNFDCSLGFADHYGFRNSYGKAFQPYDLENGGPYNFVEAPLHFMDGTFHKYMKIPTSEISKIIIQFYEKNSMQCDFSLLWHNTYFTDYKYNSFLDVYKKIVTYIYENKIRCLSPQDLVSENRLIW